MKIRGSFVSNSSSASFTCDICGKEGEGYDWDSLSAGMIVTNDGTLCLDHFEAYLKAEGLEKEFKKYVDATNAHPDKSPYQGILTYCDCDYDKCWENHDDSIKKFCPFYNLHYVSNKDLGLLVTKFDPKVAKMIRAIIRSEGFSNLRELKNFLGEKDED